MSFATYRNDAPQPLGSKGEESSHYIPRQIGERVVNIDGSVYQANNVVTELRAALESIGGSQTYEGAMAGPTREEINAEFRASAAETETKIARLEGKMDLVLSKLDGLNSRFEDARADAREARTTAHSDNVATRANIWVAFVGLAAVIIAIVLLFPTFFDFGAKIRDRIADEVKAQMTAPPVKPAQ
jgi:hypothetical protein